MKVCVETHQADGFGEIPEGSLWEDDSPYATDASKFADVDNPPEAVAEKPKSRVKKES
jgi:hypothetical protein